MNRGLQKNQILALILVWVCLTGPKLWAEAPLVEGFWQARYEEAWKQVDRSSDANAWFSRARDAQAFALARWESSALALLGDSDLMTEARKNLTSWLEKDLETRFSAWLRDRFLGQRAQTLRRQMMNSIAGANLEYLYEVDANNEIVFDESGDPKLIRPGETGELQGDLESWLGKVQGDRSSILKVFQGQLAALAPEIVSLVGEHDKQHYQNIFDQETTLVLGQSLNEWEALAQRESKLFVARRSADVLSLRKKTESEAATAIASELATATAREGDAAIQNLLARIENSKEDGSDLALEGEDWLKEFELQFDKGLATWQKTEENFMVRRIEWERDAGKQWQDGEAAWADAFKKLQDEKYKWEEQFRVLYRAGETAFATASDSLAKAISEARIEFEADALKRRTAGVDRVQAQIDILTQSLNVVQATESSIEFWKKRIDGLVQVTEADQAAFLFTRKTDLEQKLASLNDTQKNELAAINNLNNDLVLYETHRDMVKKMIDGLINEYDLVMGNQGTSLGSILSEIQNTENFHLDEYQVELIRASAIAQYWSRRKEIAEAVYMYAQTDSAKRPTDAESKLAFEAAQNAYRLKQVAYDAAVEDLATMASQLGSSQKDIEERRLALVEAQEDFDAINTQYQLLVSAKAMDGSSDTVRDQLVEEYKKLLMNAGLLVGGEKDQFQNATVAWQEALRAHGYDNLIAQGSQILEDLVRGSQNSPSLATLDNQVKALIPLAQEPPESLDSTTLTISEDSPYYFILKDMVEAFKKLPLEDTSRRTKWNIMADVVLQEKTRLKSLLEARLDAISLLGTPTFAAWLVQRGGTDNLEVDRSKATLDALRLRLTTELDILDRLSKNQVPADDDPTYQYFLANAPDLSKRATIKASLDKLVLTLGSASTLNKELENTLDTLAQGDFIVASFLRGTGSFVVKTNFGTLDLISLSLEARGLINTRAKDRLEAYSQYGAMSLGLEAQKAESTQGGIEKLLQDQGLSFTQGSLPKVSELINKLIAKPGNFETNLAEFVIKYNAVAADAPTWMANTLSQWRQAFVSYGCAKAVILGSMGADIESLEEELETLGETNTELNNLMQIVQASYGKGDASTIGTLDSALSSSTLSSQERDFVSAQFKERLEDFLYKARPELIETMDWQVVKANLEGKIPQLNLKAPNTLVQASINSAMEAIQVEHALTFGLQPKDLSPGVAARVVEHYWSTFSYDTIAQSVLSTWTDKFTILNDLESALVAENLTDLTAEEARLALVQWSVPDEDGNIYLDTLAQLSGDEATFKSYYESLLEPVADAGEWTQALLNTRVQGLWTLEADGLLDNRDDLRTKYGEGSIPFERAMTMALLSLGVSDSLLDKVLGVLGLGGGSLDVADLPTGQDAWMDLAFKLPIGEKYQSLALEFLAKTKASAALGTLAQGYGGNVVGDTLGWSLDKTKGNLDQAMTLNNLLTGGSSSINQWLMATLGGKITQQGAIGVQVMARLSIAQERKRLVTNEADAAILGRLHWRTALKNGAIASYNNSTKDNKVVVVGTGYTEDLPSNAIYVADSWNDGVLMDAWEVANQANTSLVALWERAKTPVTSEKFTKWTQTVAKFVQDYQTVHNENSDLFSVDASSTAAVSSTQSKVYQIQGEEGNTRSYLAVLGATYNILQNTAGLQGVIDTLSGTKTTAQETLNIAMESYEAVAASFTVLGEEYDKLYGQSKLAWNELDLAGHKRDIQEAITRYAGTAYLQSETKGIGTSTYLGPKEELDKATQSKTNADAALDALKTLYTSDTKTRTWESDSYKTTVAKYKTQYTAVLTLAKAKALLNKELGTAKEKNQELHDAYMELLGKNGFGGTLDLQEKSTEEKPLSRELFTLTDDGFLVLRYEQDNLSVLSAEQVTDYTNKNIPVAGSDFGTTQYQENFQTLQSYLASGVMDQAKLEQWALARDYLERVLLKRDDQNRVTTGGFVQSNLGFGLHHTTIQAIQDDYWKVDGVRHQAQRTAYEVLAKDKTSDIWKYFSTFVALSMNGLWQDPTDDSYGNMSVFDAVSATKERAYVIDKLSQLQIKQQSTTLAFFGTYTASMVTAVAFAWLPPVSAVALVSASVSYGGMIASALASSSISEKTAMYEESARPVTLASATLQSSTANRARLIKTAYTEYQTSTAEVARLEGPSTWTRVGFNKLLSTLKGLTESEVTAIMTQVDQNPSNTGNNSQVLESILQGAKTIRDNSLTNIELLQDESMEAQALARQDYRRAMDDYIAGTIDKTTLETKMKVAFGPSVSGTRMHLATMATILKDLALTETSLIGRGGSQTREILDQWRLLIDRSWQNRMTQELAVREDQWRLQERALEAQHRQWVDMGSLIKEKGDLAFKDGIGVITSAFQDWGKRFESRYKEESEVWNYGLLNLQERKLAWVNRANEAANSASSIAALKVLGQDAEAEGRQFDSFVVGDLVVEEDAAEQVATVLEKAGVSKLTEAFVRINALGASVQVSVRRGLGGLGTWNTSQIQAQVNRWARESNEVLAASQAKVMAATAKENLEKTLVAIDDSITSANENMDDSMDQTFLVQGGWKKEGDRYVKDAVIHSTILDPYITERVEVDIYKYFAPIEDPQEDILLSTDFETLDAISIRTMIAKAQDFVKKEIEKYFGTEAEKAEAVENSRTIKVTHDGVVRTDSNGKEITVTYGAGHFGRHVGFAPVLKAQPDPTKSQEEAFETIAHDLNGTNENQMYRLMGAFIFTSLREQMGWAMANKPAYDKTIWDDRDTFMKSPTVRGIVDMGVNLASQALPPGLKDVVGLLDDLAFGALDVMGGHKDLAEVGLEIGKKGLSSLVSMGTGAMFGGAMEAAKAVGGVEGLIATTMVSGMQGVYTTMGTSMVNALELNRDENGNITGLGVNKDAFKAGLTSGLTSLAGSLTSGLVTGGLNLGLGGVESGFWKGAVGLAGSVANKGAVLGITALGSKPGTSFGEIWDKSGGLTLNVLDFGVVAGMLGDGVFKGGFDSTAVESRAGWMQALSGVGLNLHIGSKGVTGALGQGSDIALMTNISQLVQGLATRSWAKEEAKKAPNSEEAQSRYEGFGYSYSYGDAVGLATMERLRRGYDNLDFGGNIKEGKALTTADAEGRRTINLGSSVGSGAQFAVELSHEAWRDGFKSEDQSMETRRAVRSHTQMAMTLGKELGFDTFTGREDIQRDLAAMQYFKGGAGFDAYADGTYNSSADYWKVMNDGSIFDDGKDGQISFEDGRETIFTTNKTKQGSLEEYLGLGRRSMNGTLDRAGFVYTEGSGWTQAGKTISAEQIKALLATGGPNARKFENVASRSNTLLRNVSMLDPGETTVFGAVDDSLTSIKQTTRAIIETAPIVGQFIDKVQEKLQSGNKINQSERPTQGNTGSQLDKGNVNTAYPPVVNAYDMSDYVDVPMGRSDISINKQGCRLVGVCRILNAAGYDVTPGQLAKMDKYFNDAGELQTNIFSDYNLSTTGDLTGEAMNSMLKDLANGTLEGWVIGIANFGSGTHTININSAYFSSNDTIEIDWEGTSARDMDRHYVLTNVNSESNYYLVDRIRIITRNNL